MCVTEQRILKETVSAFLDGTLSPEFRGLYLKFVSKQSERAGRAGGM